MDKSTGDITKKKRPPAAGVPILVRLQPDLLTELDEFRDADYSRPEAIRAILTSYFTSQSRDD